MGHALVPIDLLLLLLLCMGNSYVAAQQFTVQPESVVQAEGLEAVFECLYLGAVSHSWGINGEFPTQDQLFPPDISHTLPSGDTPARLIIPATPQYNNTVVQCQAVFQVEGITFRSSMTNNTTMIVQGPLSPIPSLRFHGDLSSPSNITISWAPPFSLNLTTAEPDIQYCVDVYNVTGGGDDHLQSVCDITDTYYTFTASDPDQLFNFTVTPRSNVEGSLNGTTSQPVQGYVVQEPVVVDSVDLKRYISLRVYDSDKAAIQLTISKDLLGSIRHTPTNYTFEFDCVQAQPFNYSATPKSSMSNLLVVVVEVKRHQICKVSLFAMNSAGQTKYSSSLELSTHDVQLEQAVYSSEQVDVSCSYLEASQVRGYLVIVFSEHNLFPAVYGAAQRNRLELTTNVSIPSKGLENPMVVVYDLKNPSGLPERIEAVKPRPAHAMTTTSFGSRIHNESSLLENASVSSENRKMCLNCSFSADELTGCVGVIHSAQLDNLTLTVLSVERSGGVNCTVDELMEGNYSVAVFGLKGTVLEQDPASVTTVSTAAVMSDQTTVPPSLKPADGSTTAVIAGVVCGVAVGLLLIVLLIVLRKKLKLTKFRVVALRSTEAKEESPPHCETLPVNNPDSGYEYIALASLNQSFTEPVQVSSKMEDTVSTGQVQMEPDHTEEHPQTESPDSPLVVVVDIPQEPVYGETKEALEMQTLINVPSSDSTEVKHQYSEVSGAVNQESGVHYAELDNKRDPGGGQSSEDPTRVQYASIDEQQLVPVSNDDHVLVEDVPAPQPPPPETVLPELNSCVDPIPDSGQKEGECVPGRIHSLPNDSLHEKEEYGRKITAEKCPPKQLLNGSVQYFVGQSSPKMTVRLDTETSELESSSSDIKDNAQMKIFSSYECSSKSAYSQQDVPPKPKAHTLTCSSSELIHTKEVVQVRKQGHESREDRNETDEPSDNSLNKICSPESADVEHLNNCTCDKGPSPNHLNNFNCVCAETSFQAGKSEPVFPEMPITNIQKPSSTCCTGTLAIDVSSRTVVTGVRSNYQSLGGYKLPTQTTDSPNCGQENNRNLMVGRDFQAEMTKKVTTKHYQGFIGKSTSIWNQLIATVSNNVLSFDEFQTSTKARTPRTKSRSDSVVNPKSSEEKVEEKGPFPKDLKPVTYSPSPDSDKKLIVVKIVDKEASSKSFREASGKAQGGKEQHRMWPWKLHMLPSHPQDWNDINTEDGLQLPKHGVLFQPLSLGHWLLAWRAVV